MAKNKAYAVSTAIVSVMFALLLSSTAWAALPLLQIAQVTNTNCLYGNFYPSTDAQLKKVAFTSFCDLVSGQNTDGNSELFVMSIGGSGLTQLTHTTGGVGIAEPQFSANGEIIVFASDADLIPGQNSDGNFEIFTIHTNGTHLTQLTNTVGGRTSLGFPGNTGPCFDPKAQRITFSSDRDLVSGGNGDGNNDLFVMNVDGTGLRQLTFTTGGFGMDGGCLNQSDTKVVLSGDRDLVGQNSDRNYEVFTMNVDGTNVAQLTNTVDPNTIGNVGALWTANGVTIFFRSDFNYSGNNPDANQEAFRMNANGTGIVQLTSSVGGFGSAITGITPNGKTLIIESDADLVPGSNLDRNGEVYAMRITP